MDGVRGDRPVDTCSEKDAQAAPLRLLAPIEFDEETIGRREQIFVCRRIMGQQRDPTREFCHHLRPFLVRQRLEFFQ